MEDRERAMLVPVKGGGVCPAMKAVES
jgi:hypothetical protein